MSSAVTQLALMKMGEQDKFDAKDIAMQVASTIASFGIEEGVKRATQKLDSTAFTEAVTKAANTATNALLGHAVTSAPINVQNMAAQAVGSVVGEHAGSRLSKSMGPKMPAAAAKHDVEVVEPSNHEIAAAEAIARVRISEPVLELPGAIYGEASYELSKMNQDNMTSMSRMTTDYLLEDAANLGRALRPENKILSILPLSSCFNRMIFGPISNPLTNNPIANSWDEYQNASYGDKRRMQARALATTLETITPVAGEAVGVAKVSALGMFARRAGTSILSGVEMAELNARVAATSIEAAEVVANARKPELFGVFGREKSVYHTVTSAPGAQGVLDAINPKFFNPHSRFGKGFYLSEVPDTSLAELTHHNAIGVDTIRFNFNNKSARILDLTNPKIAKTWGYEGGDISALTRDLGVRARSVGFNVIRYPSERGIGNNLVVFNNFEKILQPQMIVPIPQEIQELTSLSRHGW